MGGGRYVEKPAKGIVVVPADVPEALDLGFGWTDVATTHTFGLEYSARSWPVAGLAPEKTKTRRDVCTLVGSRGIVQGVDCKRAAAPYDTEHPARCNDPDGALAAALWQTCRTYLGK